MKNTFALKVVLSFSMENQSVDAKVWVNRNLLEIFRLSIVLLT